MLILDTQILIWYINQSDRLSKHIKERIETTNNVAISAASCFEVAWLVRHGRIQLPADMTYHNWITIVKNHSNINILPIDETICELAVNLPEHHKDPMDRMIIATALYFDSYLASMDTKFPLYDELKHKLIY